jgi:CheY-like chemotaxis protein/PAS domain-containing protein
VGREVSCRAWAFFRAAAREGAVSLDALLEGIPVPREVLEDVWERVDWDVWAALCDRYAALVGGADETLFEHGARFIQAEGLAGALGHVVGALSDPIRVYTVGMRWVGPSTYACVDFALRADDAVPRRLHVSLSLRPGFRPSRAWFLMAVGGLAGGPEVLGVPRAAVRYEVTSTGAVARVDVPERTSSRGLLGRLTAMVGVPRARPGREDPEGGSVVLVDVDDVAAAQRAASEALERARVREHELRAVFTRLPAIVLLHRHGLVELASEAAAPALGHDRPADLEGRSLPELVDAQDLPALIACGLGEAPAAPVRVRLLRRDGGTVVAEVSRLPTLDVEGSAVEGFFASDVARLLEAERDTVRHREAALALRTVAAGVAHELNNPLTYVLADLDAVDEALARAEAGDADALAELRAVVADARAGAERMAGIVRTLRRVATDEAAALTGDSLLALQSAAGGAAGPGTAAFLRPDATGPRAPAPGPATADDPASSPSTADAPAAAGAGAVGPLDHDAVLARARRRATRLQRERGSSVVERVVPPLPRLDGVRVLVVDDEPPVARALRLSLQRAGAVVDVVHSGESALAHLRSGAPVDAILCDLMMPEVDGATVYEGTCAARPELAERFVFVTGGAFTERARVLVERVRPTLLEKPSSREALCQAIAAKAGRAVA